MTAAQASSQMGPPSPEVSSALPAFERAVGLGQIAAVFGIDVNEAGEKVAPTLDAGLLDVTQNGDHIGEGTVALRERV